MNSIEEYLSSLNEEARTAIDSVRECIKKLIPESEELLNYEILAFALVPGGKRDSQVMIAGYDKHVGFYPGPETIVAFSDEISGFKSAKGSVQFPLNQPIPLNLVSKMVKHKHSQIQEK